LKPIGVTWPHAFFGNLQHELNLNPSEGMIFWTVLLNPFQTFAFPG
jgi:hypothetical protein